MTPTTATIVLMLIVIAAAAWDLRGLLRENRGQLVSVEDDKGCTALHHACRSRGRSRGGLRFRRSGRQRRRWRRPCRLPAPANRCTANDFVFEVNDDVAVFFRRKVGQQVSEVCRIQLT